MPSGKRNHTVEILGIRINLELLGIFLALTPVGVYLSLRLDSLSVWEGAGAIWIAYLIVILRHPPPPKNTD
jgi:hypothetical protein